MRPAMQTLEQRGFALQRKWRFPGLPFYRASDSHETAEALEHQRSRAVRVEKDGYRIYLEDWEAADNLASLDDAPLAGLAQLPPEAQTRVLHSLGSLSPGRKIEHLARMADNTIVPGVFQAQVAQLAGRLSERVEIDVELLDGRIPDEDEFREIVERARQLPINHDYIKEYCYARAHLIADEIRQAGVNVEKYFAEGELTAKNAFQTAYWDYHVAPGSLVRTSDGKISPRLVDFSFSPDPLELHPWLGGFVSDVAVIRVAPDRDYDGAHNWSFEEGLERARSDIKHNNFLGSRLS